MVTLKDVSVSEGSGTATIGATLNHAPQTTLVVTLSNGATITFEPGYVPGTVVQSTAFLVQGEDVFVDAETIAVSITSTNGGGNFEKLDISSKATVKVEDTIDTFSVTIQSNGSVTEGDVATFTINLSQSLSENLKVTLSNGATVLVEAGKTSVTYTLPSNSAVSTVEITDASVPSGKEFEHLVLGGYSALTGSVGNDTLSGSGGNDVMIADVQGLQVLPGQNYNIAFIVDTSGSMKTTEQRWVSTGRWGGYWETVETSNAVEQAKEALLKVFDQLLDSVKGDASGKVNVYLSDFDSSVQRSVSVDLSDPNAKAQLTALLDSMKAEGGTNYEAAFKDAANWFHSSEVAANPGSNLTYFITDGKPTFYQTSEKTNPVLVDFKSGTDLSLDGILKDANYKPGDVVTMNLGGESRVIVDADGTVYKWTETVSKKGVSTWSSEAQTSGDVKLLPQGDGTYELSKQGGYGNKTDDETTKQSGDAFKLLADVSKVEAIGLGNNLSNADLKDYDSDGVVQTNIDASKLAEAILGTSTTLASGNDTVHGGKGDDILFGDQITVGELQGFAALQKMVADKLGGGLTADKVTVEQVHDYITKHADDFANLETSGGGKDELHGGAGNDILFGQGGDDKLYGEEGNDILYGGTGDDRLDGGVGNDLLVGGSGNDTLIGGDGDDTFVWNFGDQGTARAPASDVVKDFGNGNDKLDLSDLLQGEEKVTDLSTYLHFDREGDNTVLKVSSTGVLNSQGGNFDQKITLEGVKWDAVDTAASQNQLIKDLITQGKLVVDGH